MSVEILEYLKDLGKKYLRTPHTPNMISSVVSEGLTHNGLELAYSTHANEARMIKHKMEETSEKRKLREGKEFEQPTEIKMSKPDRKGVSRFTFIFHKQEYFFHGPPDLSGFREWITDYSRQAESCITCDQLLFPGERVGVLDSGLMHMTRNCCPSGGFYAGHINNEGKLKPAFSEEKKIIE